MVRPYSILIRPITDRAFWDRFRDHGSFGELRSRVLSIAESAGLRPSIPSASDYLAARRLNDRDILDRFWREERVILSTLIFRRCLLGLDKSDADDRLLNHLWEHLTHPTWAVVAHLPGQDLPASGQPTLDLAACEMAAMLAETREALLPWMNEVSGTLADSVLYEIDARVLTPFAQGYTAFWTEMDQPHNWLGVCAGSILAACESLAAQGHPRPAARARAIECLKQFIDRAFTHHGECDEGVNYWVYGLGFASIGMGRLHPAELKDTFDLIRLRLIADYPGRVHLFDDVFYAGNDAQSIVHSPLHFAPWLAALTGSEFLASWSGSREVEMDCRTFCQILRIAAAIENEPELVSPIHNVHVLQATESSRFLEDQQVAIFRLSSSSGEIFATFTGGHNDERHNHNDLGTFTVHCAGVPVIPDLGAPFYTADFFGPDRYKQIPASSRGHCCPLINGYEQRPGRNAIAVVEEWEPQHSKLKLDLTAAYPPEAGLKRWTREMSAEKVIVIKDEFHVRPQSIITHVIWSSVEPMKCGPGSFQMGAMRVDLNPAPSTLAVTPVDPASMRLRSFSSALFLVEATYLAEDEMFGITTQIH